VAILRIWPSRFHRDGREDEEEEYVTRTKA
jgi:hypothetical protein